MRLAGSTKLAAAILAGVLFGGTAYAAVRINEVMARNDSAVRNGADYPRSYVELYNDSSNSVSLNGWYLTNNTNTAERLKYAFPSWAVIPPNSYLVVWCNQTTNGPGFYTGFDLKKTTDEVGLYQGPTNAPILMDYVKFGFQITDLTISRVPDITGTWKLAEPTPGYENAPALPLGNAAALRFNEWLGDTPTTDDWFELYNPATNGPVDMAGLVIRDAGGGTKVIRSLSFINSNSFALFLANGKNNDNANECPFSLNGTTGDALILLPYLGAPVSSGIHAVTVSGGLGPNVSEGYLPDGYTNNLVRFYVGKNTPGDSNFQFITNVVINEILAHTDLPLMDAIEFYNPTTNDFRLDYYYLSNSEDNPKKYQFPPNTVVPALGYLVVYENAFNLQWPNDAISPSFTLNSARGDQVVLCSATNAGGPLTGYRLSKTFDATANGISLGRFIKSDGKVDTVPMSRLSLGTAVQAGDPTNLWSVFVTGRGETNPYPLVGPVVISEIMYHPPDLPPLPGTTNYLDDSLNEYIELSNTASTNVPLFNPLENTNRWKLKQGIDFEFPSGVVIPAHGCVLVVNFDPTTNTAQLAAFKAKWNIPADFTRIYGPYEGKLANDGMLIELIKPDPAQRPPHPDAGYVPQIFVEKVNYEDQSPWPTNNVDGGGWALHRVLDKYANDEVNWFAGPPSPGVYGSAPAITQQPVSQSVVVGGNATFAAAAAGIEPLSYQWQFNAQNVPGGTTNALTLTNVQTNQAGGYRVIVSNASGAVTSAVATLTVAGQPVIVQPTVQSNGSVQVAFGTVPGFTYMVDGSPNLTNWVPLATYTNAGSQVLFQQPSTNRYQFFRARLIP